MFALSLAVMRLVLAGAHAAGGRATCCGGGSCARTCCRRRCSLVSIWVPEPLRYVLWAIGIAVESGAMLTEDREAARRARREHDLLGAGARRPRPRRSTPITSPSASACS